jgi:hypothetical protein
VNLKEKSLEIPEDRLEKLRGVMLRAIRKLEKSEEIKLRKVNTTNRESDKGVVRCFTNRLGLCNTRVRGKRGMGRRRGGAVNKQKRVTGVLEGLLSLEKEVRGKVLKWIEDNTTSII